MKVEKHLRALEQYRDRFEDAQFVSFTAQLWELGERCAPHIVWDAGSKAVQERRVAQRKPLFSYETPQMGLEWAQQTLAEIRSLLVQEQMVDTATSKLVSSLDLMSIKRADIADALLNPDRVIKDVCTRLKVGENAQLKGAVALMVVALIRIFATAAAQHVEVDLQHVELPAYQRCPVCGGAPALATVRPSIGHDGGHRFLYCHTCETVWHFPRIRCAHCGETNPHQLRYVHGEGDEMHQLHLCATCGHATPTVMQSHRPPKFLYSPRVEELYGTHLAHAFLASDAAKKYFEN